MPCSLVPIDSQALANFAQPPEIVAVVVVGDVRGTTVVNVRDVAASKSLQIAHTNTQLNRHVPYDLPLTAFDSIGYDCTALRGVNK